MSAPIEKLLRLAAESPDRRVPVRDGMELEHRSPTRARLHGPDGAVIGLRRTASGGWWIERGSDDQLWKKAGELTRPRQYGPPGRRDLRLAAAAEWVHEWYGEWDARDGADRRTRRRPKLRPSLVEAADAIGTRRHPVSDRRLRDDVREWHIRRGGAPGVRPWTAFCRVIELQGPMGHRGA